MKGQVESRADYAGWVGCWCGRSSGGRHALGDNQVGEQGCKADDRTKLIQDASSPSPMYTNLVNGTIGICRTEGFGGIYRGLAPTVSLKWKVH